MVRGALVAVLSVGMVAGAVAPSSYRLAPRDASGEEIASAIGAPTRPPSVTRANGEHARFQQGIKLGPSLPRLAAAPSKRFFRRIALHATTGRPYERAHARLADARGPPASLS